MAGAHRRPSRAKSVLKWTGVGFIVGVGALLYAIVAASTIIAIMGG